MYIYTYMHIYIYTHIHMYIYLCTHTHIHIYTYIHTYIYTYTYIHIYIYTYIPGCASEGSPPLYKRAWVRSPTPEIPRAVALGALRRVRPFRSESAEPAGARRRASSESDRYGRWNSLPGWERNTITFSDFLRWLAE